MKDQQAAMVRAAFKEIRKAMLSQDQFPGARVATGHGDMDFLSGYREFKVGEEDGRREIHALVARAVGEIADEIRAAIPASNIAVFRVEPEVRVDGDRAMVFCRYGYALGGSESQPLGGPALTWPKVLHVPADAEPLPDEEVTAMFEQAFSTAAYDDPPEAVSLGFKKFQRLMVTLDRERQQTGRLRHWVANAGSNVKKPDAEARVLFLAGSTALNRMVGGDLESALEVMELAINQVALSRAGRLTLDMDFWAQVETRATGPKLVRGKDLVAPVGPDEPLGHRSPSAGPDDGQPPMASPSEG